MGERAPPFSVVTAKSWNDEENIWTNRLALSSFIRCSAAMLATNPMPGNPSIRIGLFSFGFSLMSMEQTMVYISVNYRQIMRYKDADV